MKELPSHMRYHLHASVSAAFAASALVVLLAAPEAMADLFGSDIPLLGTLVSQGAQELTDIAQLIRTANEQLAAAKRMVGYVDEARAALAHFQHYAVEDFGDDILGLTGGAVPVSDARRLASGVASWAPATGELRSLFRRCLASESSGSAACRQMHEAITQEDARRAVTQTFGRALHADTMAADYEAARGLSASDAHTQQEAARAALSASSRKTACKEGGDAAVCALAQAARQESQLDTVNAQLGEANRLQATGLALQSAERKRALAEAHERREALAEGAKALGMPAVEVHADGVSIAGGD